MAEGLTPRTPDCCWLLKDYGMSASCSKRPDLLVGSLLLLLFSLPVCVCVVVYVCMWCMYLCVYGVVYACGAGGRGVHVFVCGAVYACVCCVCTASMGSVWGWRCVWCMHVCACMYTCIFGKQRKGKSISSYWFFPCSLETGLSCSFSASLTARQQ